MPTIIDGSLGVTYPVTAGGTSAVQSSSSKVLQVVQNTYSTQVSTTSSSFVDTGLSASITPTSSSSKILVFGTVAMRRNSGSVWGAGLQIVRGSTSVFIPVSSNFWSNSGSTDLTSLVPYTYLDSPATTSSTTYKIQYNAQAGAPTVYAQIDGSPSVIVLMEIAG